MAGDDACAEKEECSLRLLQMERRYKDTVDNDTIDTDELLSSLHVWALPTK